MNPDNPVGRQVEQQAQGRPPGGAREPDPISEMTVSTPTLLWISMDRPLEQIPLGPDDHVLDSNFNHQIDAWEVLVIVQPDEEGGGEGEEE
jgi:hypothetical protein